MRNRHGPELPWKRAAGPALWEAADIRPLVRSLALLPSTTGRVSRRRPASRAGLSGLSMERKSNTASATADANMCVMRLVLRRAPQYARLKETAHKLATMV